jgi:arylsulfatase A-like enzyme
MPISASAATGTRATSPCTAPQPEETSLITLAMTGLWFGLATGLLEGAGLLIFQRLNWQRWGPMVHVSKEILWISPIVDALFFLILALLAAAGSVLSPRFSRLRLLVFVLIFLSIYDGMTLTERFYHRACVLLALGLAATLARWFQKREGAVLRFWKKSLVWLVALWAIVFAGMQAGEWIGEQRGIAALPPAPGTAPNVILIVIDTLRADHVSAYGYARHTTPNLDRLASEGALFENAISACSWTLPSHASLLTGRYPSDHGMRNAQPMPWLGWRETALRGYPTLGAALERRGYRTAAFSANQTYFTSNVGLGRGFAHFEDYFQSADDMLRRTLFGREFDRAYLHRSRQSAWTRGLHAIGLAGLLHHGKRASEVNRATLAWIDRGQRPFFVFLNYIEVHDADSLLFESSSPGWGTTTAIDRYDSALTYVDSVIAELRRQLERRGLSKNTLIIVTGDHGESLGQHHTRYHGITLYREQIHVPLLFWYPRQIPASLRVAQPVSNTAIAPTIMDLVGDGAAQVFRGGSLAALGTAGGSQSGWPSPISQLARNEIVTDPDRQARNFVPTAIDGDMRSLVTPRWHLILHQTLGVQLYDWEKDPGEVNNLIDTPEGRTAATELLPKISE